MDTGGQLRAIVGTEDVTEHLDGTLTYSNADPGGMESCSLQFGRQVDVRRGTPIRIEAGLATGWEGRTAEPGARAANSQVAGEGYGARLKDGRIAEIWLDQNLAHWEAPSAQRQLNYIAASFRAVEGQVRPDETTGEPSLATEVTGAWTAGGRALAEAWYRSNVEIGSLYFAWKRGSTVNNADGNWVWEAYLAANDTGGGAAGSGTLRAAGPGSGTLPTSGVAKPMAFVQLWYGAAGGAGNVAYPIHWTVLAVRGTHGLPLRGVASLTKPQGLWASDIVRNILGRVDGVGEGVIVDSSGFEVGQLEHRKPVAHEQAIADAASFMPWHWGTWEPLSILDTEPRFDFRPYPEAATAWVRRADCEPFDLPERLSDLYDVVQVTWQDSAGTDHVTERTRTVDELAEAGISRTLDIDMGLAGEAQAQVFGDYVLELAEATARSTGTATLRGHVGSPSGPRPAHLLRAGLDKLAVPDLPGLPLLAADRREFNLRRVEVSASNQGISTQIEMGAGSSLLEVLQARLAVETELAR